MARVRGCVRGECAGTGSQELARLSLVPVLVPGSLPCCFASALPRTLNMYVGMYLRNPSPSIDPEVETSLRFAFPSLCLVS